MKFRVKEICKEKGLLFKELAAKLGITQVALRNSLKRNCTIGTLERIAAALEVPVTDLFVQPTHPATTKCPNCGCELHVSLSVNNP